MNLHVQNVCCQWARTEEKNEQLGWKRLKSICKKGSMWKPNGFHKSAAPEHLPQDRVSVAVIARECGALIHLRSHRRSNRSCRILTFLNRAMKQKLELQRQEGWRERL